MSRIHRFQSLYNHPFLSREINALPKKYIDECIQFLAQTATLTDEEYALAVNRWRLDQPELRTKWYPIQWALLTQSVEPKIRRVK